MEIAALPTLTDVEAQRIKTLGYMLALDPKPGDTTVPALPDDLMRMIWAKIWQQDAACIIQRAVRALPTPVALERHVETSVWSCRS